MAIGGLKPFVTVYSTFTQRAFDQLVHDVALQNLPVRIMLDRGGFVGNDGPTHHGVFDHSYLRLIPNLVHMAPRDEREMRRMMLTALAHDGGPIAMRYPRGETPALSWSGELTPVPIGRGELLRDDPRPGLLFVAVGSMVETASRAAEALAGGDIPCSVVDARFIKPLDEALLAEQCGKARAVVTLEENVIAGGMGEGLLTLLSRLGLARPARLLGVPDRFVSFGSQEDQLRESGLTPPQVIESASALWQDSTGAAGRLRRALA
jgi:1-deoxy-D-xylulose-5-phosphate synthase